MTSTTARLLLARPWLAPALGGLVMVASIAAWRLFHAAAPQGPLVHAFTVTPGLRSAHVTFTTARAMRAAIEVQPSTDKTRVPPGAGPATEFAFDVTGLAEGAEHKLTLVLEGERRVTVPFKTETLLIERFRKEAQLDRVKLTWTTTLPVRSSLLYAAENRSPQHLDLTETAGTSHEAVISGLTPDLDYDVTILSHTDAGEEHHSSPYKITLFKSAANETVAQVEQLGIGKRILDVLWEYRHKNPDPERIKTLLREQVDPLRLPLKAVRATSGVFFDSPGVLVESKFKVYAALKLVEHLERLAAVQKWPLVELLAPFDWGRFAQVKVSFGNATLPLPQPKLQAFPGLPTPAYIKDPLLLPGIHFEQQLAAPEGPKALTEWREKREELDAIEMFARGERDGVRELTFSYGVADPLKVQAAELWIAFGDCSPLQFFEVGVNRAAPLILRPPLVMEKQHWYVEAVGVDPALLIPGQNTFRLRLKPIPEMLEGRRVFVWFTELRLKLKM